MDNKRNSLKKIAGISAVASVLPSTWVKPVISSIVLPAHAQTSSTTPAPTTTAELTTTTTTTPMPMCSSPVQINTSFSSRGHLFGIADCAIGRGIIDAMITSYAISGTVVGVVIESDTPVRMLLFQNVSKTSRIKVVDGNGRDWEGSLTFTYDGSQVNVTGTMNLV